MWHLPSLLRIANLVQYQSLLLSKFEQNCANVVFATHLQWFGYPSKSIFSSSDIRDWRCTRVSLFHHHGLQGSIKTSKTISSTVTPIGVILANRKKQKFIYLFILATCPANGDGDGDDTVKSNFLVMIFYAAFGNTLTALLRQSKIFWPFVKTVSIYIVHCWGPGYRQIAAKWRLAGQRFVI